MLVCKTWHHLRSDRLISAAAAFPLMLSTSDTPASLLFANMPGLFPPQTIVLAGLSACNVLLDAHMALPKALKS